jgi:hypothetical protein
VNARLNKLLRGGASLPKLVSASPAIPLEYTLSRGAASDRLWTIGSLTYTTAGLALVIFWLLLAQVGLSLRDRAAGDATSLLLRRLGASNTALAFLTVVVSTAIVVLFGPAISYRSDRFRSR